MRQNIHCTKSSTVNCKAGNKAVKRCGKLQDIQDKDAEVEITTANMITGQDHPMCSSLQTLGPYAELNHNFSVVQPVAW